MPRTATKKHETPEKPKKASTKSGGIIDIKELRNEIARIRIVGLGRLVTHAWNEKIIRMMAEKQQNPGRRRVREAKDPEAEFQAACYHLSDGTYGFPAKGIKKCLVKAGHRDIGIPMTTITKSVTATLAFTPHNPASSTLPVPRPGTSNIPTAPTTRW